jgi:L-malate glycosyltransferase
MAMPPSIVDRGVAKSKASQPPRSSSPLFVTIVAVSPRWIGGHSVQANLLMRGWEGDPDVRARFVAIDPAFPGWLAWVKRVPVLRTLVRQPFYWAALWRGTRNTEIAHIFSASYWSFLLAPVPAWWVARLKRIKVLIHYHSGEARDHLRHWRTALPILKRADGLVVPSQHLVEVFREFGLDAQIVPNILDEDQFSYQVRQPLRPALICTRGFHPYYRVDLVVRAFAAVQKVVPNACLYLLGEGPEKGAVRDLVKSLGLCNIEFVGNVPHAGIHHFYKEADIFVNASWLDNMPVSILEAFASGTPVVTTAAGGIPNLVEHERTGLLCKPGDWEGLGRNVIRLLDDPQLAVTLARNAHDQSACYKWPAVRSRWLDVYKSLLRR